MANINLGAEEPTQQERLGYPKPASPYLPIKEQIERNMVVGGKWDATWSNRRAREAYPGETREKYEKGWDRIFGQEAKG